MILDAPIDFAEQNRAVLSNALACERIIGRRLTDGEYLFIVRLVASARRAQVSK